MQTTEIHGAPLPLGVDYSPDVNSCVPATFAYCAFRLGAPEEFWHPVSFDGLLRRESGSTVEEENYALASLVELGAKITVLTDFDDRRFVTEGMGYLLEYHADGWLLEPEKFYGFWTDDKVIERVEAAGRALEFFDRYRQDIDFRLGEVAFEHALSFLSTSDLVMLRLITTDVNMYHNVLLLDADEPDVPESQRLVVFDNQCEPPILEVTGAQVQRRFKPKSRTTIVHLPSE